MRMHERSLMNLVRLLLIHEAPDVDETYYLKSVVPWFVNVLIFFSFQALIL